MREHLFVIALPNPRWRLRQRRIRKQGELIALRQAELGRRIVDYPLELEPAMVSPSCTPQGARLSAPVRLNLVTGEYVRRA